MIPLLHWELPAEYQVIPEWFLGDLNHYLKTGWLGSHFVERLLSNDLHGTLAAADPTTLAWLPVAVRLVYNRIPSAAWGSPEKISSYRDYRKSLLTPREQHGRAQTPQAAVSTE